MPAQGGSTVRWARGSPLSLAWVALSEQVKTDVTHNMSLTQNSKYNHMRAFEIRTRKETQGGDSQPSRALRETKSPGVRQFTGANQEEAAQIRAKKTPRMRRNSNTEKSAPQILR